MTQRSDLNIEGAATTDGIPVAPLAAEDIAEARVPIELNVLSTRETATPRDLETARITAG